MNLRVVEGDSVNWGILGAGNIAQNAIAPAITASNGSQLLAVASRSPERAKEIATRLGAPRAYSSYTELLGDPDIHAVYIGLPNGLHEEWVLAALAAGKHVLCEKSLTFTLEAAVRMAAAADDARLYLAEAFMYRHHPQWVIAREILATGRLGRIRGVRAVFTASLTDESNHRWSGQLGMGALYDVGCYAINACRYLLASEPVSVAAQGAAHGPDAVDGTLHVAMNFAGNIPATAIGSLVSAFEQDVTVTGERRIMRMHSPFIPGDRETHISVIGESGTEVIVTPAANHFLGQIQDFVEHILGHVRSPYPAENGVANVRACEAALKSWREGRVVSV